MSESSPASSYFERFRRQMDLMDFETLPLFNRPHFAWSLRTDVIGRRLIYRPQTESTMDDARAMVTSGRFRVQDGAIVLAEAQSAGRGRAGRSWVSPPDVNLYFTLVMRGEPAQLRHLAYLTPLSLALAIEEVAAAKGVSLHTILKWPNDVQIGGRKVAGVLIETTEDQEGANVALVGAGVNVNLDVSAYPEIAEIATSVKEALGFAVPREEVLASFCNHFEVLHTEVLSGSNAPFLTWRDRLITLGREVVATGGAEVVHGRAVDVTTDGALVIETADGRRVTVEAGDVTLSAR